MKKFKTIPFFGVIADPQSYLNIVYLLLGLPLGVAYFVFLVSGISVGFGLLVIWIGVPILVIVLLGAWAICQFELLLTNYLLKENIPSVERANAPGQTRQAHAHPAPAQIFCSSASPLQ